MKRRMIFVLTLAGLSAASPAFAASSCDALMVASTFATRKADAAMIRRDNIGQALTMAQIGKILAEGPWRLIWATPLNAERGVYFYRRAAKGNYRLIGTWGGILPAEERADGIAWARKLKGGGPSELLTGCFADVLIAGE